MNILLLDSATEACTCAVSTDSDCRSAFEIAPRGHAEKLLPMAESLLADLGLAYTDLDLIAYGQGPGSFTGVRIATACAQGIAMGLDLPLVGISSLATLAQGAVEMIAPGELIHAAIDARMGEVYHATFTRDQAGTLLPRGTESVSRPETLELTGGIGIGTGFSRYRQELMGAAGETSWGHINGEALPHATDAIMLARQLPPSAWRSAEQVEPVYLRNNVATPPKS